MSLRGYPFFDTVLTRFALDFKHGATARGSSLCAARHDRGSVEQIESAEVCSGQRKTIAPTQANNSHPRSARQFCAVLCGDTLSAQDSESLHFRFFKEATPNV